MSFNPERASRPAEYELHLFGPPCLNHVSRDNVATGKRAGGILIYLALSHDLKATRERLSSLFWGDRGTAQARASLRQALLDLRQANGPAGPEPIIADRYSVALDARHVQTDLGAAEAAESASGFLEVLQRIGSQAPLDVAPIGEAFDQWRLTMVPIVEGWLRTALLRHLDHAETAGDHAAVIALADAWAARDPLDQVVAARAISAEIRAGNRAAAERRFRQIGFLLERDRGTLPDRELIDRLQEAAVTDPTREPDPQGGGRKPHDPPETGATPPATPAWRRKARLAALPAALLTAASATVFYISPKPAEPAPVVAVLPFKATGGSGEVAMLAEGVSEAVMNRLAEDQRLRVIGPATTQRLSESASLRGTALRRLDVGTFLSGQLVYDANRKATAIKARLVDSRTGQSGWETTVQLRGNDFPTATDRLVDQVVQQLLDTGSHPQRAPRPDRLNPDAYVRIVQARRHIQSREGNRLIEARELALQATEIAPQWAEAHAVRSIAASLMQNYTDVPLEPLQAEASAAAARALSLDPKLPAAHEAQSLALEAVDANGAMAAAGRAVQLRPGNAEARRRLAWLLRADGQYRQAAAELEMAIRIDPLWYLPYIDLGISLAQTNQPARMIAWQARHAALNPPLGERDLVKANMLLDLGRAGEAAVIAARLIRTEPGLTYAALTWIDALVALFAASSIPVDQLEINTSLAMMAMARGDVARVAQLADDQQAGGWEDSETQVITGYALMAQSRPGRVRALHRSHFPTPDAYARSPAQVLALGRHPGLYPALAFAAVGDTAGASIVRRKIALDVARLERLGLSISQSGVTAAALALMDGRRARSLDRLEASLSAQDKVVCQGPIWIGIDPLFRTLAGEPRFMNLLARCVDRLNRQRQAAGLAPLTLDGQALVQRKADASPPAPPVPGTK